MRPPILVLIGLAWAVPAAGVPLDTEAPSAIALLRKTEALMRSRTSVSVYRMHVVRPDWQRDMRFRSHDDRTHRRARVEILAPRKSRGTVFLKIGDRLSMYLPKLRRQVKISPAMLGDPWMGSDFTNQDLLQSASFIDDYQHRVVASAPGPAGTVYTIESLPRPDTGVVWERLRQKVRADGIPLHVDYLDCKQRVVRRLSFDQVRELGGRRIPSHWTMRMLLEPGHYTEITIEEIQFDAEIPETLFTRPGKRTGG